MTKNRIRFGCGIGALLAAAAVVVAGCGGDDTTVIIIQDGGAQADGTVPLTDSGKMDGSSSDDATVPPGDDDGSVDASGDDSSTNDASMGADAGDAGDAGDADAGPPVDQTVNLTTFANNLATAYCTRLGAQCATSQPTSGFTMSICLSVLQKNGPENSTYGLSLASAQNHADIAYNATLAAACINDFTNIDWTNLTGAVYTQAMSDCFGTATGLLTTGEGCFASIECAPHLYCKKGIAADGGDTGPAGACEPVEPKGTDCSNYESQGDSCSTRGSSLDHEYCNVNAVCAGPLGQIGDDCFGNLSCATSLCSIDTGFCVASENATADYCAAFAP